MPAFARSASVPLLAMALLAGCGPRDSQTMHVIVVERDAALPAANDRRLAIPAAMLRAATAEGLVAFDADGRVVPAMADRWIVTDGGLSYIFRLRDGTWADGTPVTGETVRNALRAAIAQQGSSPLAADLSPLQEIRAMAGRVIEIRLATPMPDLLTLLAQPELGLMHHGKGEGPMAQRPLNGGVELTMIPPARRGLPASDDWAASVRPLTFATMPGARALAAFVAGQADVVVGGGFADLPRVQHVSLPAGALRFDQASGLFGLLVVRATGFLAAAQNREALALAVDRDSLTAALGATGWLPTTRIVTPGLPGDPGIVAERWSDIALDGRRELASRRVSDWVQSGAGPLVLTIALPVGPGADILFDRLANDFAMVGITLHRAAPGAVPDLRVIDALARYPRAEWFLDRLSCAALAGPCSPDADTLTTQARTTADPAQAALIRVQAENAMAASNVFVPFGPPVRWSLVRGAPAGFAVNRLGFHPLPPLAQRATAL